MSAPSYKESSLLVQYLMLRQLLSNIIRGEFPGDLVVRLPNSPTALARVQSLVWELRSSSLMAQPKKKIIWVSSWIF